MTAEPQPQVESVTVEGFTLPADRLYDPVTHVWALPMPDGTVRLGLDALSVETTGTLAGLDFLPEGTPLQRGTAYGTIEAAKFVGPLACPLSATFVRGNAAVLADPGLIERDPYGEGWLADVAPTDLDGERVLLLSEPGELLTWLTGEVADYRERGLIAE